MLLARETSESSVGSALKPACNKEIKKMEGNSVGS